MSFATDTFAGLTATTELNGRTASGGGTWSGTTGVLSGMTGGGAVTNTTNTGRGYQLLGTPTGTDYSVQCTLSQANTDKNSLGLVVRHAGNYRIFGYYEASTAWKIYRRDDNNGDFRLDSDGVGTNPPTSLRTVILTCSGVSPSILLTLKSDGTQVASATLNNTNYDAKGGCGLYYNFTDSAVFCTLDDYQADDTDAGGRTTKNTRSAPLGTEIGMGWRMRSRVYVPATYAASNDILVPSNRLIVPERLAA